MRTSALALAILFACLTPRIATADSDDESNVGPHGMSFEVGGFLGLFIPSEDHEFYDTGSGGRHAPFNTVGPDLGLRLGFLPIPYLALEAEVVLIPIGTEDGDSATLFGGRGQLLAQYPGRITPFATAGFGVFNSSSDALGNDTDGGGYVGIGAKYYVKPKLPIRLDARLSRMPERRPQGPDGTDVSHFEVLVGASWTFGGGAPAPKPEPEPEPEPDTDGDGFTDVNDSCPTEAGVAPDGCPIKDSDGDGLNDPDDKCPNEAETKNGFEDDDGCPDEIPDSDGDGLADDVDKCKDQAEDVDSFEDEDGCPDPDNDGDGVTDDADNCPNEAGVVENKGCPDTDRDGDGIVDRLDNCPDEPGTAKNHGCKKKQLVQITTTQIKILDKVYFRTGKARIRKRSNKLLDNLANVLTAHPEIKKLRVEGHTDDRGDDASNKELSQKRADAVVEYLVGKGIEADRLEPVGFGEDKPIEDNKTRKGRAANRRVEFNIVDQ